MRKKLSREFKESYLLSFVWIKLSTLDILKRYRRSILGPFWITITTLVTTTTLSFIYSKVLNVEIYKYFPYLTIGLIYWNFVSTLLNESCETFIESERIIKQENFSFVVYVLRVISRNYIILFHNLLIFIIIFFVLGIPSIKNLLLFTLSLVIIFFVSIPISFLISILSARYRDIPPIVASLLQLSFFATPILFKKNLLGEYEFILQFNPFFYFLEIFRNPILGEPVGAEIYIGCIIIALCSWLFFLLIYNKSKDKISFWI